MYYMYGILCFGGRAALSHQNEVDLCKLQIAAYKYHIFVPETVKTNNAALRVRCLNVTAGRSSDILREATLDPSFITNAVRLVFEETPGNLEWRAVRDDTAWFEAESTDEHLYSVNLLEGVVLYDGCPPSPLPGDILQQLLYTRAFGAANFEVSTSSHGIFRAAKPIRGRFYEFSKRESVRLVMEEMENETRLQLLSHDGPWAKEFS